MTANLFIALFCVSVAYLALRRFARARSATVFTRRMLALGDEILVPPTVDEDRARAALWESALRAYAYELGDRAHEIDAYWLIGEMIAEPNASAHIEVPEWVDAYKERMLREILHHCLMQSPLLFVLTFGSLALHFVRKPFRNFAERFSLERALNGPTLPSGSDHLGRLAL